MASRTLQVAITGDAKGAQRAFNEVEQGATSMGSKLTSKLGGLGKTLGTALLGGFSGFVGAGIFEAVSGAFDAAQESLLVGKQTAAVLKSTGGAANVSQKHVEDLANALKHKTAIDDEVIQSGENVLLTFTKVRNEAGKGNKIFDQATKAALDMSVALKSDLKTASIQVGKALNDPISGVTALRKAGVQLTDQQEAQIKAFVDSGDVLSAQKIILGELKTEFGGSANAGATGMKKLQVAFGDAQEAVGKFLVEGMNKLEPVLSKAVAWVQANWPEIQRVFQRVMAGIMGVVTPALNLLQALWQQFGDNVLSFVQEVWPHIQQVIEGVMNTIGGIIKFVMALIQGDWSGAWDAIKQIVSGVWEAIKGIVGEAWAYIRFVIGVGLEVLGGIFSAAWDGIKSVVGAGVDAVVDFITGIPGRLLDVGESIARAIIGGFKRAWNAVANTINDIIPDEIGLPFGLSIDLPDNPIPRLAKGGIVTGPTLALIGEAGPEAVVPLSRAGGMGATNITVHVHGSVLSDRDIAQVVAAQLNRPGGPQIARRAVRTS